MVDVLIADDNAQNRYYLEVLLQGNGFAVRSATNGAEALEMAQNDPPGLLISDILMPIMDGFALCREWRADERLKEIPFIFYTATFTEPQDETLALGLGANRFVIKPQEPEVLLAIIREVLAGRNNGSVDAAGRDDRELLQEHGQALFRKLSKKMAALEEANLLLKENLAERQRLEDQLRHAQKMEAIGQLAGGVAHDFNNILSVIMGYASMLKLDRELVAAQAERVDQILGAAEKGAYLTRSLLSFSRRQVMKLERTDLNDIVRNIESFLARILEENIHLKVLPNTSPLPVLADTTQIEQVLMNLVTNGRDAMPQGGELVLATDLLETDAALAHVHGFCEPGRYARVTVSDTGIGMEAATREKIFEPFFTTKADGKGTGLGMAIVYGIVKQHNGYINVYSEPGKGTTFNIYLPLDQTDGRTRAPIIQLEPPRGGEETILVAEDNEAVRTLVEQILGEFGYRVIAATDGLDALRKFREHQGRIDLVLLDLIMPKSSGPESARELRRLDPEVKILFSSGYPAEFVQRREILGEHEDFIVKPVRPLDLLRTIRHILDRPFAPKEAGS